MRFAAIIAVSAFMGCGIPYDCEGTYTQVLDGKMRAGVAERPPWTRLSGAHVVGTEVDLLKQLARRLNSDIEWTPGSESELLELLHQGKLDVVVSGLTKATPWSHRVALTQSYIEAKDHTTGKLEKHVWAVRRGENRWLLELDEFLQAHRKEAIRLFEEAAP